MLPKEIWEKLPKLEQKKILWWTRWRWCRFQLSRRFYGNTPAPIRLSLKTAAVSFLALFLLPQHPISIPVSLSLGLGIALATHRYGG